MDCDVAGGGALMPGTQREDTQGERHGEERKEAEKTRDGREKGARLFSSARSVRRRGDASADGRGPARAPAGGCARAPAHTHTEFSHTCVHASLHTHRHTPARTNTSTHTHAHAHTHTRTRACARGSAQAMRAACVRPRSCVRRHTNTRAVCVRRHTNARAVCPHQCTRCVSTPMHALCPYQCTRCVSTPMHALWAFVRARVCVHHEGRGRDRHTEGCSSLSRTEEGESRLRTDVWMDSQAEQTDEEGTD